MTSAWIPRIGVFGALASSAIGACALEPDVGPLLAGRCSDADTNPQVSVSFAAEVRPLINRGIGAGGCSCHLQFPSGPGPGIQLAGLDLSSMMALREGGVSSGPQIVVAGQPCASILFQKVSDAPPFGSRMPLDGPPFLTPAEVALIHDWIAEGAANN